MSSLLPRRIVSPVAISKIRRIPSTSDGMALEPSSEVLSAESLPGCASDWPRCRITSGMSCSSGGLTTAISGTSFTHVTVVSNHNKGRVIILDKTQTIVVQPSASATILDKHVAIEVSNSTKAASTDNPQDSPVSIDVIDPVQLAVFGYRFMSIAEQMGRTLQKTSVSLNIKERLDFSCVIFGPDGGLGGISGKPNATYLEQEGTLIKSLKLASGDDLRRMVSHLTLHHLVYILTDSRNYKNPGCISSNSIANNLSDLKVQITTNQRGSLLIQELFVEYGTRVVQRYMAAIQQTAEMAVRNFLNRVARTQSPAQGSRLPRRRDGAAVYTGNSLTSQRVTDVVFRAFSTCAASQGCMNSVQMYGGEKAKPGERFAGYTFMYGETSCGGNGAGPTWRGVSAIFGFFSANIFINNMTNTRVTDLEILEKRYPVLVKQFSIRPDSSGQGLHPGVASGACISREMAAGGPGKSGRNLVLLKLEGGRDRWVDVGGKGVIQLKCDEQLYVHTPEGGGWVSPKEQNGVDAPVDESHKPQPQYWRGTGSLRQYTATQNEG
ncbi:hypothetical protein VTN00DRAFT_4783 [Thermoascus crustaceus]|uniref:uncharacterized protein n=1 Tax=Thermoascus crustaceus TaxID=5088 RepID=UPI00374385B6